MNQCPNCKALVSEDAKFCKCCAADLSNNQQSAHIAGPAADNISYDSAPFNRMALIIGGAVTAVLLIAGAITIIFVSTGSTRMQANSNSYSPRLSNTPRLANGNYAIAPPPPPPSNPSPPTPDQDARKQAEQYLESNFTRCGDSYYLLVRLQDFDGMFSGLYQLKGLSISMEPVSLTEADRQNGIEWKGAVEYKVSTNRVYDRGVWEDWRNGGIFPYRPNPLVMGMNKRNGKWNIEGIKRQKVNCDSIPQ